MSTYKFTKPKASYLKKVISYLSASKGNWKKLRDLSHNLLLGQLTAEHQCKPVIFPFFVIIWKFRVWKHTYWWTGYKKGLPWIASNEDEYISYIYTLLLFTQFLQLVF
jgi:hypothetical protein